MNGNHFEILKEWINLILLERCWSDS